MYCMHITIKVGQNMFIWGFIVGAIVGSCIGILTIALVSANSRIEKEDHYERIKRQN